MCVASLSVGSAPCRHGRDEDGYRDTLLAKRMRGRLLVSPWLHSGHKNECCSVSALTGEILYIHIGQAQIGQGGRSVFIDAASSCEGSFAMRYSLILLAPSMRLSTPFSARPLTESKQIAFNRRLLLKCRDAGNRGD